MKNIILGVSTFILIIGAITITNASSTNNGAACTKDDSCCKMCPCTPDCQPGDEACVCPMSCNH